MVVIDKIKGGIQMLKITRLLVCLMIMAMSSLVALTPRASFAKPSEEKHAKKEEVVYATERGKKYHKKDCRFLKNRDVISLSKKEAKEKGLEPCGRCFKEEQSKE